MNIAENKIRLRQGNSGFQRQQMAVCRRKIIGHT